MDRLALAERQLRPILTIFQANYVPIDPLSFFFKANVPLSYG